jgi:alpha-tubulin suppressor-like RCC1 family protein
MWASISGVGNSCFAVSTSGALWAWGNNSQGQLGLSDSGAYTNRSSPVQVGALTNWRTVSQNNLSTTFAIATKTDGTLWSWGDNAYGKLGLGNTTYYSSPKQIGALTSWYAATSVGGTSSGALQS